MKDLEKGNFEMLGVRRLGDQKRLRVLCQESTSSQPGSKSLACLHDMLDTELW